MNPLVIVNSRIQAMRAGLRVSSNEITERYARACEADVLRSPADWLWSYRRWRIKKPLYGVD